MKKPNKVQIVAFFGIVFIIVGGSIIYTWAYQPLLEANEWIQNPTCDDLLICLTPKSIYSVGTNTDGSIMSTLVGTVDFSSRGQFAINSKIHYEINLNIDNPEFVKEIYFVIASKNEDFSSIIKTEPNKFFQDMKQKDRLIDMQKISEHEFYRNGFWTIDLPIEHVFLMLVVSPENTVSLTGASDVLFSIVSPEVKAQDNANIESRITNKTILGLTWMGIGLGFALLGADFIARVVLRD